MDDRAYAAFRERIVRFMLKAAKEAKVNTSWINPNAAYEQAMADFVAAVLERPSPFLDDFLAFQRPISDLGMFNSLSQTLLKLASPGVSDIYQGTEIWDFSLVDPDNRRPVDYRLRRQLLSELERRSNGDRAAFAGELLKTREDGRIKLYVTHRGLAARRECPALFLQGHYQALRAVGPRSAHVCAFARAHGGQTAIAVAPVLVAGLTRGAGEPAGEAVWGATKLVVPRGLGAAFRNLFTDELLEVRYGNGQGHLPLRTVLGRFPVALLISE
jgi:(1->4)-alpha-D-glucan 1-alpha-D-glucosylmutase